MNNLKELLAEIPEFLTEEIDSEKKRRRVYNIGEGKKYPSITTVLSSTKDTTFLDEWISRIGEEAANFEMEYAKKRGTTIHSIFEEFLLSGSYNDSKLNVFEKNRIHNATNELQKCVGEVYAVEKTLYSDRLEIAGRVDAIVEWKKELAIFDVKTSKKRLRKDWSYDYFLQTCGYACMVAELTRKIPKKLIIFNISDDQDTPTIFEEIPLNWLTQLLSRIRMYYNEFN